MLVLSSDIASRVYDHFKEIGTVCPPQLKRGIFTTAACDNIDHNPSSQTSAESFHRTGISLIQHPDKDFLWIDNTISLSNISTCRAIPPLPDYYTNVEICFSIYLYCTFIYSQFVVILFSLLFLALKIGLSPETYDVSN